MPSETALNLTILELLQALNEKLTLECTKEPENLFPHGAASTTPLKTEVSAPGLIHYNLSCEKI
jgi:hypothetical protein